MEMVLGRRAPPGTRPCTAQASRPRAHGQLDAGVLLLAKPYRKSDLAHMIRAALAA